MMVKLIFTKIGNFIQNFKMDRYSYS